MLKELKVDNYVLIQSLRLNPSNGFNIITGETGAGKSILLGALGLILGDRADIKALSNTATKCIIEGVFSIGSLQLKYLFEQHDLDYAEETILRREITPSGKSRAFINDTPVSLQTMKALGAHLVDIHSQHQNLQLGHTAYLMDWLDTLSGCTELQSRYKTQYSKLQDERGRLTELQNKVQEHRNEQDYNEFLMNELTEINLDDLKDADIESEHKILENAEEIGLTLSQAIQELEASDNSVIEQIRSISQLISKLDGGDALKDLQDRINSVRYELDDIASELAVVSDKSAPDPERLQELNEVMAKLYNLQTKHKVLDIEGLIEVRESIDQKLSETLDSENELQTVEASISSLESTCSELANELHSQRLEASSSIMIEVNRDLAYLGLPNAELTINITEIKSLGQYGLSEVEFLFASNKGSTPQPVHKVASGGELSRLMLIMKSLLAQHKLLPTMIFDEIDTGVSGEIALKMGEMMERLSEKMQVMSITHLPQIASKGKTHFYVYKQSDDTSTATFVKELQGSDRVMVLAQMLSGDNPTEGAIANAKELLN